MKKSIITEVVDGLSGYAYLFIHESCKRIPAGAKVTVEWDEPGHHECDQSRRRDQEIYRGQFGHWFVNHTDYIGTDAGSKRRTHHIEISYCPACGEKLGDK